jgi:hypothetical protein
MRTARQFKREFKAFLAGIGFKLKHFLPDDTVVEPMFPDCPIARTTGYEKLRGEGGLTEELALQWAKRSNHFLAEAIKNGHRISLDGISFIDYEAGRPKVNWQKLISLYEPERRVPVVIKLDRSIDNTTVADMLAALRTVVGVALIGSATFALTVQLRMPRIGKGKLALFALSHALIACLLCGLAYKDAGGLFGLLALAASTGWYQATWFTAASIVGDRIGSARAAVIATTLEGAVGFTAFVVFRLLQA